jgi:hypothetical protein
MIFVSLLVSIACSRNVNEVPQKKLNGINGEAVYLFNKDGSISGLFKAEYNIHDFAVLLIKDTISLGDDFVSTIRVTSPNHVIEITSPTKEIILSDTTKSNGFKDYKFRPDEDGIYNFTGIIKYDTVETAFEYKFVVVRQK